MITKLGHSVNSINLLYDNYFREQIFLLSPFLIKQARLFLVFLDSGLIFFVLWYSKMPPRHYRRAIYDNKCFFIPYS